MLRSFRHMALVAALASTSTWVVAQQASTPASGVQVPLQSTTQPPTTQPPTTQPPSTPGQVLPGQPNRPGSGQDQLRPGQVGQGQQDQNQPGQMGQGISLTAFIAHKMKRSNESEVELAQLASQRAQSDSVKQFAQKMIQDHTQMIQKLEQFDQGVGSPGQGRSRAGQPGQPGQPGQTGQRGQGQPGQNQPGQNQPGQNQPGQNQPGQNQPGQTGLNDNPGSPTGDRARDDDQQAINRDTTPAQTRVGGDANQTTGRQGAGGQAGNRGGMAGRVPQMLVALADQSCDNELQMARQMLEEHQGSDFEMAYIGQQIVAHGQMIAHLQALKTSGPDQLQQLATQGEQTARQHLEQAKKIAQELKGSTNR